MCENSPPVYDPKTILQLKDDILCLWRRLPPEHQAAMARVVLASVTEGVFGVQAQEVSVGRWPGEASSPGAPLAVAGIRRADLARAGLSDAEAARIDDRDVERIARWVEDHLINDVFWDEVAFAARIILAEKGNGRPTGAVSPD